MVEIFWIRLKVFIILLSLTILWRSFEFFAQFESFRWLRSSLRASRLADLLQDCCLTPLPTKSTSRCLFKSNSPAYVGYVVLCSYNIKKVFNCCQTRFTAIILVLWSFMLFFAWPIFCLSLFVIKNKNKINWWSPVCIKWLSDSLRAVRLTFL